MSLLQTDLICVYYKNFYIKRYQLNKFLLFITTLPIDIRNILTFTKYFSIKYFLIYFFLLIQAKFDSCILTFRIKFLVFLVEEFQVIQFVVTGRNLGEFSLNFFAVGRKLFFFVNYMKLFKRKKLSKCVTFA